MSTIVSSTYTVGAGQTLSLLLPSDAATGYGDSAAGAFDLDTLTSDTPTNIHPTVLVQGVLQISSSQAQADVAGVVRNDNQSWDYGSALTVAAGGRYSVSAPTANVVSGIEAQRGYLTVENDGDFTVTGGQFAFGAKLVLFLTDFINTSSFQVSGDIAYGVQALQPAAQRGTFSNTGTLQVVGHTVALGFDIDGSGGGLVSNGGSITATASSGAAIGIHVSDAYGGGPSVNPPWGQGLGGYVFNIQNSGTITASTAILADGDYHDISWGGANFGTSSPDVHVTNSGVINGDIRLGPGPDPNRLYYAIDGSDTVDQRLNTAEAAQIVNTGTINGQVFLPTKGAGFYDGRGGVLNGALHLGGNDATVYLGADGETVYGGAGAARVTGGAGADLVGGGSGDDTIDGGAGDDRLDGGGGVNTVSYASATAGVAVSLALQGNAQDTGGGGRDVLSHFQNLTGSAYNDTLEGDANNNVLDGGGGIDTVSYAHAAYGVAVSLALQGSAQNTLGAGSDLLSRFQNLTGSAFDDILAGDANANVLDGGAGINTVSYADATAGVTVSLALQGSAQTTGGAGTDTLFNFANLTGSAFNDALTGDANANGLTGGGGDDTLTGNGGADTFVFGQGGGADIVTDFSHAQGDRINLSAFPSLHTLADVQAIATQSGADAVLSLPGGGSVTLDNVTIGALTRSDVVLAGTPADFSGAGVSNVVWQNTSGAIAVWSVSGQALSGAVLPIATPGWHLQDTGDFNGDGKSGDLLFRDGAGEVAIWQMNGLQLQSPAIVATVPIDWQIQGTGDFNGDGKSDILWRNLTTGDVAVWQMNGVQIQSPAVVARIPLDWHVVGTGDFNGDGKSDILWRNATSGDVAIWQMNGAQIQTPAVVATIPTSWHIAATGDFNGDGKADLLWQNSDTGQVAVWAMNGAQMQSAAVIATLPTEWKIAGTADINGDGKADILWQNASTGQTAVWEMNGLATASAFYLAQVDHSWAVLDHHFDWV